MLFEITQKLGIEGHLSPKEMDTLFDLSIGKICLEIGSWKGLSSFCLALGAKMLTCVDTFKADGAIQSEWFTSLKPFQQNTVRFGNIRTVIETSKNAEPQLKGKMFDLIFLDGDHTYAGVKQDVELWIPHLKPKGLLVFHDYGSSYEGIQRYVHERFGSPNDVYDTLAVVIYR